jgi:hypothetical protein
MTLTLQVPGGGNTLHTALVAAATGATGGFAAFAFATSTGIDTALAEPAVHKLLGTGQFQLVVGLDAITDTAAVAALKTAKTALPNASISLFYNPKGGVLYHPKTMFFKRQAAGQCLTGSGNLTLGGLRNNWEAFWKADVSVAEAAVLEAQWAKWVADHKDNLLQADDPRVTAQAALNAKTRAKIQKAVKETDAEALAALEEHRQAVAVKSSNFRFEVEALGGLQHPVNDHFILVFERIGKSEYRYVLLKPGELGHTSVQKFLDDNYFVSGNSKRRVVVTQSDVQAAWADNPLLLH